MSGSHSIPAASYRSAAMRPILSFVLVLVSGLSLASACRAPREPGKPRDEVPALDEDHYLEEDRYLWVSESVQGRPLVFHSFGDEDAETILFVASIHGDERAGTPLLETLIERLTEDPSLTAQRRAVVVPVANPDGVALGTRRNANDTDLNRNFPAENFLESPLHGIYAQSEPETSFLRQVVERFRPTGILTFHQAGNIVDFDGPATGWAYRLAATCDDLVVRRLGARPGSLGSWAGTDLGSPRGPVYPAPLARGDLRSRVSANGRRWP